MLASQSRSNPLPLPVLRMVALGVACILAIALYWDSMVGMASLWSISSYRHAPFVPVIAIFMLWRDREAFETPFTGSWLGLLLLLVSLAIWVAASAAFVQALEHLALFGLLNGLVWTIVGNQAYKRLAVPFGFLVFAAPIGGEIVPWLMTITADISAAGLESFRIPFHREAMVFTLSGGRFEVADVCSGIRYLNVGLMIGSLVAILSFRSWSRRIGFVCLAAVAFIATNGVRAFLVMAIASATEMRYLAGYDHVVFGWILFLVVLVAMIFAADRWSDA